MGTGNGHDPTTKQIVELLLGMQAGIDQLNSRFGALHEDVSSLSSRFAVLHEDMAALRADVTGIRNEVRSLRSEFRADLESLTERTERLETAVFKPAAE